MARYPSLLLLCVFVFLGGCLQADDTASDRVRALRQQNHQLRAEVDRLRAENDRLTEAAHVKDDQIRATTRLVHKMLDDLNAVAAGQGLVRGIGVNPKAQLAADFPQSAKAVKAAETQFMQHLAAIESLLRDSEQQIERVRNSDRVPADAVSTLNGTIDRLREALSNREADVAALQSTVDSLSTSLEALRASHASLKTRNEQLAATNDRYRTAYYVVGTGDELEARGIINQRWLRPTEIRPFDASRFETTTTDVARIDLPDERTATVLSPQREHPSLYSVETGALVIHDPAAFWARSKFLIVEID